MKKMIFAVMMLAMIASVLPAGTVFAGEAVTYDLMAGQGIDVGSVTVEDDGTNLIVTYNIDVEGWHIIQAHLYAGDKAPKKAAPGSFPFKSGPIHATSYTFTVPLAEMGVESGDELFIATHALVNNENNILGYMDAEGNMYAEQAFETVCPTLGDIAAALPEYFTMNLEGDGAGYYNVNFDLDGDGVRENYDWYCIDHTHSIGFGDYTVRVFSSYETLPDAIINNGTGDNNVDHPENLDLVNWVINNPGTLTQVQIQDVIWALVDDDPAKGPATLDEAELAVYEAALLQDGFVPTDGQKLAIVLQPVDASDNSVGQVTIGQVTIGQVTFASLGLACVDVALYTPVFQEETGWAIPDADGFTEFKQGWGGYFTFTP